jgi:hypothetical protein
MLQEEECLRRAQKCEVDARTTTDDFNRSALLAMAAQWRSLADNSERHRVMTGAAPPPKPQV